MGTLQPVQAAIYESLQHHLFHTKPNGPWMSNNRTISEALEEQERIGWVNFLMGMWSKKWRQAQEEIWLQQELRKSAGQRQFYV